MAKIILELEDVANTTEGGLINVKFSGDVPRPAGNNKLPAGTTMAQELANEIAWLIKSRIDPDFAEARQ